MKKYFKYRRIEFIMNVLAIGCHPDDLEIACTGTLARLAREGHNVYMAHVANGNMGHAVIMPPELREMRAEEARQAGKLIGAKEVFNIDIDDCMVRAENRDAIRKIVGIIRKTRPDFIITHNPDDYMEDHVQTSKLVYEASFTSSVPHMYPEYEAYSLVPPIYYMDTLAGVGFLPEEYVDISEDIELKIRALDCHQSQIKWMREHDKIDFLEFVRTCSRFRGLQSGVPYAEGFRICKEWPRQITKRLLP